MKLYCDPDAENVLSTSTPLIVLPDAPLLSPDSDAVSVTVTDWPTFRVPSDGSAVAPLTVGVVAEIDGELVSVVVCVTSFPAASCKLSEIGSASSARSVFPSATVYV